MQYLVNEFSYVNNAKDNKKWLLQYKTNETLSRPQSWLEEDHPGASRVPYINNQIVHLTALVGKQEVCVDQ